MNTFDTFVLIIELISITSFGISGAMAAIRKKLDMFGVIMAGVTTSIGGGIIRDLVLGIHPPKNFSNPIYALVAAVFSLLTFVIEYSHAKKHKKTAPAAIKVTDAVMFWLDSLGLAIFTVVGVATAYDLSDGYNAFLLSFVGVITGVGGGLLRDLMLQSMPYIFVKHFYASASICGSIVCIILWKPAGRIIAMIGGAAVIILLRFLAATFKWNLPRVPLWDESSPTEKK